MQAGTLEAGREGIGIARQHAVELLTRDFEEFRGRSLTAALLAASRING